ncbi:MAG: HAMP domain-containing histidine kinase [Rhizobacter sp.]|nr:HAMP domain-containing histidine kinase [Bacteriovorax sp.]
MLNRNKILHDLLRLEVAKKGQTASIAFIGFALFSFFYGYGCVKFLPLIKIISIFLVFITLTRIALYRKVIRKNGFTRKEWGCAVTLITLNAIGLSAILSFASLELKMSGFEFLVATTLLAGLVGASTVTLSYFAILFIPFQTLLLLPQVGLIIYFYFSQNHLNFLPLIILYFMYFIYQLKQFATYRKELVQLFTYQIELEIKNQELSDNKDVILDQTIKLIHTSRLAVLGEMSAGIAHEINNPLTIINGSALTLNRMAKSDKLEKESVMKHTEKLNRSVARISKIVKGLKHFSNQSDNVPKDQSEIKEIIGETTQFCQEHLISLGIALKLAEVPLLKIHCHPVQISQVLINLLKNASDALLFETKEDEKWISINFKNDNQFFYFIISNGGEKISSDISEKIFQPFFTTKGKEHGTGLGLSISQTIMKDHGGELYYDSNHNNYTTFIIKHPLGLPDCGQVGHSSV